MSFKTADLCDDNPNVQVAEPIFNNYGGNKAFYGEIVTLKLFEDNSFVRQHLETEGKGRVLVVDGGGSLRCALLGDMLAELGVKNGWAGLIIYGCIRDSKDVAEFDLGVKAINTCPLKSKKRNEGQVNIPVRFAGVTFQPGHFAYADEDGLIVSEKALF